VLELMEPGVCQESSDQRVTVVSMACLDCLVTKDTGATQEDWESREVKERTERGETTETLDPGVSQVNQALVVYWDLKGLPESLDLLVCVEMTGLMVLKETWGPKESQGPRVSRGPVELRECQDPREPMGPQERRDLQVNQVYQECPAPMALLVTQERRGLLALRETWVPVVLREQSAIPALVALRELKVSVG